MAGTAKRRLALNLACRTFHSSAAFKLTINNKTQAVNQTFMVAGQTYV